MSARASLDLCRWLQTLKLRPSCLLVAHAIGHRLGPDGLAWPSLSRLAGDTGLGRATVKRALRDLEASAVIVRERRVRSDGSHGSTVYSFGGQTWDMFKNPRGAERDAPKGGGRVTTALGGVGSQRASGRLTVSLASLTERSSLNENRSRDSSPGQVNGDQGERCGATLDVEESIKRQDRAIDKALQLGYAGDLQPARVAAYLREQGET